MIGHEKLASSWKNTDFLDLVWNGKNGFTIQNPNLKIDCQS